MDDRLIEEALRKLRWEGMEAEMPRRLLETCDEAAQAAHWARIRIAHAQDEADRLDRVVLIADQERPLIWFDR